MNYKEWYTQHVIMDDLGEEGNVSREWEKKKWNGSTVLHGPTGNCYMT